MASLHLSDSVYSLRVSLEKLNSSIEILDSGVNDFPRLAKVLETTRHFELTSESTLRAAQACLVAEIGPEVSSLLGTVDQFLSRLEAKERALISRQNLQAERLASARQSHARQLRPPGTASASNSNPTGATGIGQQLRMKQLLQKKERLSYAVEMLEMQMGQQERRKRMSMAPSSHRQVE